MQRQKRINNDRKNALAVDIKRPIKRKRCCVTNTSTDDPQCGIQSGSSRSHKETKDIRSAHISFFFFHLFLFLFLFISIFYSFDFGRTSVPCSSIEIEQWTTFRAYNELLLPEYQTLDPEGRNYILSFCIFYVHVWYLHLCVCFLVFSNIFIRIVRVDGGRRGGNPPSTTSLQLPNVCVSICQHPAAGSPFLNNNWRWISPYYAP